MKNLTSIDPTSERHDAFDIADAVVRRPSIAHVAMRLPLALAIATAGCAGLSYKEPTDGPRARVRFSTNSGLTVVRAYGESGCATEEEEWMRLQNSAVARPSPKRMGMPLWDHHENAAKEVYVDASTEKTFLIILSGPHGGRLVSCGVPLTVKFSQDKDYEIAFVWEPDRLGLVPGKCRVNLNQLELTGSSARRIRLTTFPNAGSTKNEACVDQFRKVRLY